MYILNDKKCFENGMLMFFSLFGIFQNQRIKNKEGLNRYFCTFSGYQLHDVDFRVGMKIHKMHLCGHFTGHASTGQRIVVFCPSNTTGRYVQLQIVAGNSNLMSPAEVLVWGVHVNRK